MRTDRIFDADGHLTIVTRRAPRESTDEDKANAVCADLHVGLSAGPADRGGVGPVRTKPVFYLGGYGNRGRATVLRAIATEMNALVLDCRQSPYSHNRPEWHLANLQVMMPAEQYRAWGGWWGNPARKEGRLALGNFTEGLRRLEGVLERRSPPYSAVICFCACGREEACHRSLLRPLLVAAGYEVQDFDWTKGQF